MCVSLTQTTLSDKFFVGQIIRHLNKFRHLCPVKQPEDASFLGQDFRRT